MRKNIKKTPPMHVAMKSLATHRETCLSSGKPELKLVADLCDTVLDHFAQSTHSAETRFKRLTKKK